MKTLTRFLNRVLPLPARDWEKPSFDFVELLETEDLWEDQVKRKSPLTYKLRIEAPRQLVRARRKIDDAFYWVRCHLQPSYKFHLLDLRNPGGGEEYTHGFVDVSERMMFAAFKLLVDYVEKEQPTNMDAECAGLSDEEAKEKYGNQPETYRETMDLYRWWKWHRADDIARVHQIFTDFETTPVADRARREALLDHWHDCLAAQKELDQKNLERLVRIRESLWT